VTRRLSGAGCPRPPSPDQRGRPGPPTGPPPTRAGPGRRSRAGAMRSEIARTRGARLPPHGTSWSSTASSGAAAPGFSRGTKPRPIPSAMNRC